MSSLTGNAIKSQKGTLCQYNLPLQKRLSDFASTKTFSELFPPREHSPIMVYTEQSLSHLVVGPSLRCLASDQHTQVAFLSKGCLYISSADTFIDVCAL